MLEVNCDATPVSTILDQMHEQRPLPMGRKEFEAWSDRIISGAILPGGEEDRNAFITSLKVSLAQMIMHLGPTESHKPDAFFIHSLRKGAVNQVAWAVITEAKEAKLAKDAKEAMNYADFV